MPTLGTAYLSTVLGASEAPCVSIYLPTHRSYPDRQQDTIRYKNLVKSAEERLAKMADSRDTRRIVEKLQALASDDQFWGRVLEGTAVLASPSRFDALTFPRTVAERAEVGDSFHVKPLIRHVQSADRFQVLGLSRERIALFEGNRYEMHALDVPGIPLTLTDALGAETEPTMRKFRTVGPGAAVRNTGSAGGATISYGQGSIKDETQIDTRRFFLVIDREVIDRVSNPSGLPLIPMGVEENLAEFRGLTSNRFATNEGVSGDWTNWSLPEIREKTWKLFEKFYLARLARISEDFGTASSRGQGTGDLGEAATSAIAGRVGTLLIDADRTMPGALDFTTGEMRPAAAGDANSGDMLDDLAELALKNGGVVTVVPGDRMPTRTGLAAIYRY